MANIQRDIETIKKIRLSARKGSYIAEILKKNPNTQPPLKGLTGECKGLHISTAFDPMFDYEEILLEGGITSRKKSTIVPGDNINWIIEMADGRVRHASNKQSTMHFVCAR